MTTSRILLAATLFLPSLAMGQKLDLKLDSLVSKAAEKADPGVSHTFKPHRLLKT